MLQIVRIVRLLQRRILTGRAHCKLVQIGLARHNQTGIVQAVHHRCIVWRLEVFQHTGSTGGANALGADVILYGHRHTCQRSQLLACGALGVNRCCRLQCVLLSQRDVCADFVLYSGSSCKRSLGQLYRADFFIFQHCRELGCCLLIQFHGIASLILRHAVR